MSQCYRCQGVMAEDRQWDLPTGFREFCCVNCGDRYWINLQISAWQVLHLVSQN